MSRSFTVSEMGIQKFVMAHSIQVTGDASKTFTMLIKNDARLDFLEVILVSFQNSSILRKVITKQSFSE